MPNRLLSFRQGSAAAQPVSNTGAIIPAQAGAAIVQDDGTKSLRHATPSQWSGYVRQRSRSLSIGMLSLIVVVLLPTLAVAAYTLLWASDRFVSEFRVTVRSVEPLKGAGLAEMFGIGGLSQAGNDSNAVVQYLQSREAIEAVQATLPLQNMFGRGSIDWFSRLGADPQIEKLTRYWDRKVDASYESSTGTILVRVTAFSPQDSYDIAKALLANSEALVNQMSNRARQDAVAFAEQAVTKAEDRLSDIRKTTRELQDKERTLDPGKTADSTLLLAGKLREDIARRSADLATLRLRLSDNAPTIRVMQESIAGLQKELQKIEGLATAPATSDASATGEDSRPISSILGMFQQNADDRNFAEKAYMSTLTSLETARMDAARQQVYLATIVSPGLPQEPSFPRPAMQIFMTLVIALAIWMIGRLTVLSIKEHM